MKQVIWKDETVLLPAYSFSGEEEMPMFAENRVHQRSSGNPYPNKVVMSVNRSERSEKPFRVISLENEYIRLEMMPELGGRIYSAFDKRTGYDFFYKQHVIKPALIGMLGNWISGGCEFNWPCHHRPSTFMPVDVSVEEHSNGAVTVWMSENEPLNRMKGMVGIHLEPDEARFDTRVKVYNPTPSRHSFLWWENAAVPVNPDYRLVFPPDVKYVQFHYRKNVTTYPVANGVYNGIRMGDGTDISYHKNTRQPTSYFCAPTRYDYFGGYDEGKGRGVIHVADRTVSVGKKMFTWAYNQLSQSWENALTDTDGAYAELMASSYSLNQPDFAWLMPYECREFNQMWYPIGEIGIPLCACAEAAVSYDKGEIRLQATVPMQNLRIVVNGNESIISVSPEEVFIQKYSDFPSEILLLSSDGQQLLHYVLPNENEPVPMPNTIGDNPTLSQLKTAQECYILGVHAEQYRDPAIRPDSYWREAIRHDPEYVPALTALARWNLEHYFYESAYELAMRAWKKITVRNFHPESGELQYLLGRILESQQKPDEAWDWYMQAAWAQDVRSKALTRAAMLDGRKKNYYRMADLAKKALEYHVNNETAKIILAVACEKLNRHAESEEILTELETFDPLNLTLRAIRFGACDRFYQTLQSDPAQSVLDISSDLYDIGETELACKLLDRLPQKTDMTRYVQAFIQKAPVQLHGELCVGIAYPSREIEYKALCYACGSTQDSKAKGLLGCLLYDSQHYEEAASLWKQVIAEEPNNYLYYRNLAVAFYSHLNQKEEVIPLLNHALALKPHDGQLIWEKAYLMGRLHSNPEEIIDFLQFENNAREDVAIELCRALNTLGKYTETIDFMNGKCFTPCEGGEHAVAEQYMFAWHALGRLALSDKQYDKALSCFRNAQKLPQNLGAGLWNDVLLVPHRYYEALCLLLLGEDKKAKELLDWILLLKPDYFTNMNLPELPCWQAMALQLLGNKAQAQSVLANHMRSQKASAAERDAGYKKTTPFFISYMENAAELRKAGCEWQLAMVHFASGNYPEASKLAAASFEKDAGNLYVKLIADQIR